MNARGFTLLEVLVALAIAAMVMIAVLGTAARAGAAAEQVATATLAGWVADNELARLRLSGEFPEAGTRQGSAELGGRSWRYTLLAATTEDADLRRIEVTVRAADSEDVAALLTGFVPRTRARAATEPPP